MTSSSLDPSSLLCPHSPVPSPPLTPAPEPKEDRILFLPRPPYTIINNPHFHHDVSKSITSYMVCYLDHLQEENFIKAYYQLSPFTITPTNIFANYSKECAAWWYVGRRAAARAAEKLAGYVSKGLRTALEAVPSVTTKICSFALMEEKMYYGPIFTDNPYKGCFKCFCSLPNLPLIVDHPDKIL
jgi:hypothetical protein